jgi:hypothetical protein
MTGPHGGLQMPWVMHCGGGANVGAGAKASMVTHLKGQQCAHVVLCTWSRHARSGSGGQDGRGCVYSTGSTMV